MNRTKVTLEVKQNSRSINMVKTVDKFSIENRADEEIKFAVENVIRHEYDNAVNHIKRALGMLKSIGCMEK